MYVLIIWIYFKLYQYYISFLYLISCFLLLYFSLYLHRVAPFCCSLAPQDVGRPLLFKFLPRIWVFIFKNGQIPPPPLSTKWKICSHKALIQVRSLFFLLVMTSVHVAKPCIMFSDRELFCNPIFNI